MGMIRLAGETVAVFFMGQCRKDPIRGPQHPTVSLHSPVFSHSPVLSALPSLFAHCRSGDDEASGGHALEDDAGGRVVERKRRGR